MDNSNPYSLVLREVKTDPPGGADTAPAVEILPRLIRLTIGLLLVGQDALRQKLPQWEEEAAQRLQEIQSEKSGSDTTGGAPEAVAPQTPWIPEEWEYRAVGLAFAAPRYLKAGLDRLWRTQHTVWQKTEPLRWPLNFLGITNFTQNWLDGFVVRMQADFSELEKIGAAEAAPSRALASTAINEVIDTFIKRLAENPELQDLVEVQTTGLTTEVVEEIRQRTVSTDNLLEAVVRRVLHQRPQMPGKLGDDYPPPDQRKAE